MTRQRVKASAEFNDLGTVPPAEAAEEGQYLPRGRVRRLNLRSLSGTAMESARLYRAVKAGRLGLKQADQLSRILARHAQVLTAATEEAQRAELIARLDALQGRQTTAVDDARRLFSLEGETVPGAATFGGEGQP